jgi:hypothetical protein
MDRGSVPAGQTTHAFEVIVSQDLDEIPRWRRTMEAARGAAERVQAQRAKDALLRIAVAYEKAIASAAAFKQASRKKAPCQAQSRPWEAALTSEKEGYRK